MGWVSGLPLEGMIFSALKIIMLLQNVVENKKPKSGFVCPISDTVSGKAGPGDEVRG